MSSSKSSKVISWKGRSRTMAALATTASSRPHVSMACSVIPAAPVASATDAVLATASPPSERISSTTASARRVSSPPPNG